MDDPLSQVVVEELKTTRRHFDIVAEGLESKVQLVAEAVSEVLRSVQQLRSDMAAEDHETRTLIKLSYTDLDRRVRQLEESQASVQDRVSWLEDAA